MIKTNYHNALLLLLWGLVISLIFFAEICLRLVISVHENVSPYIIAYKTYDSGGGADTSLLDILDSKQIEILFTYHFHQLIVHLLIFCLNVKRCINQAT